VRFSFVTLLNAEATARLDTLARAGSGAVQFEPGGFVLTQRSFGGFSLYTESEGLEWFDRSGQLRARRGQTLSPTRALRLGAESFQSPGRAVKTYTITLRDFRGTPRGFVRATELYNASSDPVRALDRGFVAGAILALLAGAFGGSMLARASLRQIEESYQRLRQFTADASHELRGPLAALAGTASVAVREAPELSERTRSRLEDIATFSGEMRRLIDDLLILARSDQSMERELFIVEIDAIMDSIQSRFAEAAAEHDLRLRFEGPTGREIYGNPDQIERIIANIVENAIRYTRAGGAIAVSWTLDAHRVEIVVRDTGIGIAQANLERIFDRFWRIDLARQADRGTGLGLAIARALARRHGGDVTVVSDEGKGSTFTLSLPRRPPSLK
jgi:OmpR-family two-component system manganese-sensing sensor histidine kinase